MESAGMPYKNEYADKTSHIDIINNPEVQRFIDSCEFMIVPSDDEGQKIKEWFSDVPANSDTLPENIIAVDGSYYESSVDNKLPSTKIGYVKIGSLLIDRRQFRDLRVMNNRFVDPFRVAKMQDNNSAMTFPMPSANLIIKGKKNVRDSFRYAMDKHLHEHRTIKDNPGTSLRSTLFYLAALRTGELGTGDPSIIKIHKCPSCQERGVEVYNKEEEQYCPKCHQPIYPSDCLRIWEEVVDYQSNATGLSRFMNVLEHIIPAHYIRIIQEYNKESYVNILSNIAFFIDGPLAIFGTAAWLHAAIMKYLHSVNSEMKKKTQKGIIIIGLQKTGQVVDHVNCIDKYIPANKIFAISDDYRYKYISPNNEPSNNGFGYETYYGQDFILKTDTRRNFIFSIPYPFSTKALQGVSNFREEKVKYENYEELCKVIELIKFFECDLYENAVVPVALAHKYTAISLKPGSKALDLFFSNKFK